MVVGRTLTIANNYATVDSVSIPQAKKNEMWDSYIAVFCDASARCSLPTTLCAEAGGLASTDDLAEAKVWDRIWPLTGRSTRAPMLSVVVTDDDLKHNRLGVYKHAHGHPTG